MSKTSSQISSLSCHFCHWKPTAPPQSQTRTISLFLMSSLSFFSFLLYTILNVGTPLDLGPDLWPHSPYIFCYFMKILLMVSKLILFEPKLKYYQKNIAIFNFLLVHPEIYYMILETLYILSFCLFLALLSSIPPLAIQLYQLTNLSPKHFTHTLPLL